MLVPLPSRARLRSSWIPICVLGAWLGSFAEETPRKEEPVVEPGAPVDYAPLAFYPERWKSLGLSTELVPWTGTRVVLLTKSADLEPGTLGRFLERLDGAWSLYADLTGRSPRPFRELDGKPTIAAVPSGRLTCGYGCGYIGASGIEVSGFYGSDYPLVSEKPEAFPHYYFYEMGRNYYTFGDRHSLSITGFAVFMRYVCMDALKCEDSDLSTRETIEKAEALYAESDMDFLKGFTTLGGLDEKAPRVKLGDGSWLQPSDQPVLYASAMLKLRKDLGGDAWVGRFFRQLSKCPEVKPKDRAAGLRQSLNWVVAASCAAGRDLSPVFADRWRFPLTADAREVLANITWSEAALAAPGVLEKLPADPFSRSASPMLEPKASSE